jgi:integrase
MPLTESQTRAAQHDPTGGAETIIADISGLFLVIAVNGKKTWRARFRHNKATIKEKIGDYPALPLAKARLEIAALREKFRSGERGSSPDANHINFKRAFDDWLAYWSPGKANGTVFYARSRIEANILPEIAHRPLRTITAKEFIDIVRRMESEDRPEVAKRTFRICGQILTHAVVNGHLAANPLAGITPRALFKARTPTNYARLPIEKMPEFLRRIDGYDGSARVRMGINLLAYTFVRPGELLQARWGQFDLAHGLWTIPAEVMKMRREHIVPLAPPVVALLERLRDANDVRFGSTGTDPERFLLPGDIDPHKMMTHNTLLKAIAAIGYKSEMTAHGFRGVASTALNESGLFRDDVIEAQLAHAQDNTRGAYNHALYLKERRVMMTYWAEQVDTMRTTGKVPDALVPGARLRRDLDNAH